MAGRRRPGGGRKPAPTALKVLRGTKRKDRANPAEPKPKRKIPRAPSFLTREEKSAWRRYAKLLDGLGVLTEADADALLLLVDKHTRYVKLRTQLAGQDEVVTTRTGSFRNPTAIALEKATAELRAMLAEFGLTPSSRTKVQASRAGEDAPADPGEDLLGASGF